MESRQCHSINTIWKFLSKKRIFPLITGFMCLVLILQLDLTHDTTKFKQELLDTGTLNADKSKYVTKFDGNFSVSKSEKPQILFWTGFFGSRKSWKSFYRGVHEECSSQCIYTWNQSDVDHSDVIIMNLRDLSDFNNTLPSNRKPRQIWMLHNTEPPQYSFLDLQYYNSIFNWTSFVRLDSDFPSFYGKLVPKNLAVDFDSSHVNESDDVADINSKKSKLVTWMASNCITDSGREWYIRELRRHIDVDIYGHCGKMKCSKSYFLDCENTLKQYYFYLAFENAKCRDYVTEKFWRSLRIGLIPVVMGGAGAHRNIAPRGSFIDSQDFSSPKELADYLKKVAGNATLYKSYFEWKNKWSLSGNYYCELCKTLRQWNGSPQVYHNLIGWFRQDTCPSYNIWRSVYHKLKFVVYYTLYYLGLW